MYDSFQLKEGWMPLTLTWHEIGLRLALAVITGALIGLDRGERGRPAGLRTTLLVCLAAAVAMIQANLLLVTVGKTGDSFVTLDLMRLPLGILTGMGFIGGGAILRRDGFVLGVTTAATLWFVTVMGLCFGGGQIKLGLAAFALGVMVLEGLRWVDYHMKEERHGILHLTTAPGEPRQEAIRDAVRQAGYKIIGLSSVACDSQKRELEFMVQWRASPHDSAVPPFVGALASDPHVARALWRAS
jgi:putative Mg2+ transporter-C (MgtC) family protein